MFVILTDKYGMISAGTSIPEKGKNKSSLALRPFTRGKYELYKNRESYNINAADTVESFFAIGEDVDRYLAASYALEFTSKTLPENEACPGMYKVLCDFLTLLCSRKTDFDTPLIAFQIKALAIQGLSLSQNPLMKEQSNDKISAVAYMEQHPLSCLEGLSLPEQTALSLKAMLKKYIADNLGVDDLKSESMRI